MFLVQQTTLTPSSFCFCGILLQSLTLSCNTNMYVLRTWGQLLLQGLIWMGFNVPVIQNNFLLFSLKHALGSVEVQDLTDLCTLPPHFRPALRGFLRVLKYYVTYRRCIS